MALEIERKYLVADPGIVAGLTGVRMAQGYIADNGMWVRVRIAGDTGFLTLKGPARGMSRAEFEYQIPLADAETLLAEIQTECTHDVDPMGLLKPDESPYLGKYDEFVLPELVRLAFAEDGLDVEGLRAALRAQE